MKRTWTIIDARCAEYFQMVPVTFGQPETRPGHDYFGQILDSVEPSCSVSIVGRARASVVD